MDIENEEESTSLADDLAAAWDASVEEESHDEEIQQPEPTGKQEPAGDPIGGSEEQPDDPDGDAIQGDQEPIAAQADESDKPPVGLAPAAREAWKDTPKAVQDAVRKREQDYEKGVMKYAENAKRAEAMDRVFQPYSQLFAMNGGPGNVMPGLLQTASMLQMGSPQQKAAQVAQLIKQFGVDVNTLDSLLVGEAPPQGQQQQPDINQLVDQRFQHYQQQQMEAQRQRTAQEVQSEVQAFAQNPANEFYADVSETMADLMDIAANRGRDLTMDQAYEQACQMNPQIRQILAGRASQQNVTQKRRAASSISGGPGGNPSAAPPNSTRAAIEEAWDNAGRM